MNYGNPQEKISKFADNRTQFSRELEAIFDAVLVSPSKDYETVREIFAPFHEKSNTRNCEEIFETF